jgi:tRNA(fMet)-specific endonuclease VapC
MNKIDPFGTRAAGVEPLRSPLEVILMARPLVSDALWARIGPLFPPPKRRRFRFPGRKPKDRRKVLTGIIFVLRTGIPWEELPQELAELFYGCLRSAKPAANRAKVDAVLQPYLSIPFDTAAADVHAQIRHHLETLGTPIGPYDLQIAAIAITNGCTVVTHNTTEFCRVPGLLVDDWELP